MKCSLLLTNNVVNRMWALLRETRRISANEYNRNSQSVSCELVIPIKSHKAPTFGRFWHSLRSSTVSIANDWICHEHIVLCSDTFCRTPYLLNYCQDVQASFEYFVLSIRVSLYFPARSVGHSVIHLIVVFLLVGRRKYDLRFNLTVK